MVATVGKITSGSGYEYLTASVARDRHDYYTGTGESPGVWAGSGIDALGLAGEVDPEDMKYLYGMFVDPRSVPMRIDPATGRPRQLVTLGQPLAAARVINQGTGRERVLEQIAAMDVTFSPSKSVSVLWALADEHTRRVIVDAHEEAVDEGIAYLEANAGHARAGRGGVRRVDTDGFIVAKFRHRTARQSDRDRVGDPQLHTHCAILNRVRCTDGRWRTLDGQAIYAHAHAAGALYGSRLEELLTERLGVAWATPAEGQRVLMREIDGVPDSVRRRFSSRHQQVRDLTDELLDEWRATHGREPTRRERGELVEQAVVRSRLSKSADGVGVDLHERWRTQVTDTEHAAVVGALTPVAPSAGGRVPPGDALAAQVLEALIGQRAWWTRTHVYAEVARRIDTITTEAIELETERIIARCTNLEPDPDDTYRQPDRTKFTAPTILDAESRVLRAAHAPAPFQVAAVPDETLGDDQVAAVEALCAGDNAVVTVIGPAGSGKTTMLRSVAASYAAADRQVTVLCLSAAAARVVTEETGLAADTVAMWEAGGLQIPRGSLVLVDEASMVPTLTLDKLTRLADAYGCRVGLVGDYAQMGAPEAGGLLRDLAAMDSAVEMTAVRRFRDEWERDASTELRARHDTIAGAYADRGRLHGTLAAIAHADAVAAWAADTLVGHDSIIVVDNHTDAADVSARCQQVLSDSGRLGDQVGTGRAGCVLRVGDLVQSRHNTADIRTSTGRRVLNRDIWIITGHTDTGVTARHAREHATVTFTPGYLDVHVELAYAVTIAGAQGRTTDTAHTIVSPRTQAAGLYVGMTRGRIANHAHVIQDGHLHDELGLGHLAPATAFAAAIVRDPDGELSAHRVRDRWLASTPEREQTRDTDRRTVALHEWWDRQLAAMPTATCDALAGRHHQVLDRLIHLDDTVIAGTVRRAHARVNWDSPDAGIRFIGLLNPSSRDTAQWWNSHYLKLDPHVRRMLASHTAAIVAALSAHPAEHWSTLANHAAARTHWDLDDAPAHFLDALDHSQTRPDLFYEPSYGPAQARRH
jgi:conjugative relaxase-like TrwC/TraI family protein